MSDLGRSTASRQLCHIEFEVPSIRHRHLREYLGRHFHGCALDAIFAPSRLRYIALGDTEITPFEIYVKLIIRT